MIRTTKIPVKHVCYKDVRDRYPVITVAIPPGLIVCSVCDKVIHRIQHTEPYSTMISTEATVIVNDYYYFIHRECREIAETCPEALV